MAGRGNSYYHRVRRYRIANGLRQVAAASEYEPRTGAEAARKWACLRLGPERADRTRSEGLPPDEPPAQQSGRRRRPAPEPEREPVPRACADRDQDYYGDYDYYAGEYTDYHDLRPAGDGLIVRTARAAAAVWGRTRSRRESGGRRRFLLLAAGVFVLGVFLESHVEFLRRAVDALAAAMLLVRGWVNPGTETALLFAGAVVVTGAWLFRRVVRSATRASSAQNRVAIPRDAYDRHM